MVDHARRSRECLREWRVIRVTNVGRQLVGDLLPVRAQQHAADVEDSTRFDRRFEIRPPMPHGRAETEDHRSRTLRQERGEPFRHWPAARIVEQREPRVAERRPAVRNGPEPVGEEADHALGRRRPLRQNTLDGRKLDGTSKLVNGRGREWIGDPPLRAPVRQSDQRSRKPREVGAGRMDGRIAHAAARHRLEVERGIGNAERLVGNPRRVRQRAAHRDRLSRFVALANRIEHDGQVLLHQLAIQYDLQASLGMPQVRVAHRRIVFGRRQRRREVEPVPDGHIAKRFGRDHRHAVPALAETLANRDERVNVAMAANRDEQKV